MYEKRRTMQNSCSSSTMKEREREREKERLCLSNICIFALLYTFTTHTYACMQVHVLYAFEYIHIHLYDCCTWTTVDVYVYVQLMVQHSREQLYTFVEESQALKMDGYCVVYHFSSYSLSPSLLDEKGLSDSQTLSHSLELMIIKRIDIWMTFSVIHSNYSYFSLCAQIDIILCVCVIISFVLRAKIH